MNKLHEKVVVFLPAYFAEKTLESVYRKIPKEYVDDIVLVDDGSKDNIETVARRLGIKAYRNSQNLGYGGNLKVCLQKAMDLNADIMIELHPDDQYDPACIPDALKKMQEGYDFVMGSRFLKPGGAATVYAMPLWKYVINRASTLFARAILGARISDFHCGFRVYRRGFVESINFKDNNNDYLFSFQVIAQARYRGIEIGEVPVVCRYFPGATQISFKKSMKYGVGALQTLARYLLAKLGWKDSFFIQASPRAKIAPKEV